MMNRLEYAGVVTLIILASIGAISSVIWLVSEAMPDHRCVDGFVQYNHGTYWKISDTKCYAMEESDDR